MKKIVVALVLMLAVFTGHAQSFEGIIRWNMKMEITDPKVKAQMEEAKKKANDPANQAKIKEMQARMNDPQFKAMLESNPQMKAQMDAMMKMMAGGDLSSMLPSAIQIKMKGANTLTSIEGGMMDKTDVLHLADKDVTYSISHPAKTYAALPADNNSQANTNQPKITKTSETAKINGYNATKYIIETTGGPNNQTMIIDYWASTEIKDIDLKAIAKQQRQMGREQQRIFFDTIEGFPVKVETKLPQGNMTMELLELKKGGVASSDFVLPGGYAETKLK